MDPTEGKPTNNDTNSNEYAVHSETVQVNVRYVVAIRPCRSKKTMYNSESTFYTTSYIGITKANAPGNPSSQTHQSSLCVHNTTRGTERFRLLNWYTSATGSLWNVANRGPPEIRMCGQGLEDITDAKTNLTDLNRV